MDWRDAELGAYIGPGWEAIVNRAWARMQEIDPDVTCAQVKEKFGGLRLYYDPYSEQLEAVVTEAEREAERTCEVCGAAGTLDRSKGWLKTLCPEHKAERENKTVPQMIADGGGANRRSG